MERRLILYEKALVLKEQGCPLAEIGNALGVGKESVRRWLKQGPPERISRYEPDLSPSPDLAYVAGFYLGDGKGAGHEHKVRFELADLEQLDYVSGLVAKILGREPKPHTRDRTFYVVDYDSVVLSDYLNQPIDVLVENLGDFGREFLQGFFDAEGYATCHVNAMTRRVNGLQVGAANTNLEYLHAFKSLLDKLGLFGRLRRTNRRGQTMKIRGRTWVRRNDVYHLVLTSMSQARKFRDEVGFRNTAKSEKLDDLVTLTRIKPSLRYTWFTTRYQKEGRKWVRIGKRN